MKIQSFLNSMLEIANNVMQILSCNRGKFFSRIVHWWRLNEWADNDLGISANKLNKYFQQAVRHVHACATWQSGQLYSITRQMLVILQTIQIIVLGKAFKAWDVHLTLWGWDFWRILAVLYVYLRVGSIQ